MPAHIMIVHDDADFLERVETALLTAGYTINVFPTALAAMIAIDASPPIDVLITRMRFPEGQSNGVALALTARSVHKEIKILFFAALEFREETIELGAFLAAPTSVRDVVAAVEKLLG
jgi:DNA-binding NtrC family response regulator